jgi:pimeloyl-ACP methyl ester carboxylesterase
MSGNQALAADAAALERVVQWGPGGHLVAVWTPPSGPVQDTIVVMLNAGVIHRVGAHRLHVKLARSLSAMGYGSLRFDFSGLGDSTLPPDAQDFRGQAQRDVQTVLEALAQQTQVERFALLGICSGAAHAQAAAVADRRIKGVFLVDGFSYPSLRGRAFFAWRMVKSYGSVVFLRKLLRQAVKKLGATGRHPGEPPALAEDNSPMRSAADFSADMLQLADRGVAVTLMFTGSVLESFGHARQLHDVFAGQPWLDRVRCLFEPSVDHTLTLRESQQLLLNRVIDWLGELPAERQRPGFK